MLLKQKTWNADLQDLSQFTQINIFISEERLFGSFVKKLENTKRLLSFRLIVSFRLIRNRFFF